MLRPCCALALWRGKLGEPLALGAHVARDEEHGVDLIDVLLHASLGQKELLGDLAVAQALGDERGDGAFALGEAREGGGTGAFRTLFAAAAHKVLAKRCDRPDKRGKFRTRAARERRLEIAVIFDKRQIERVRLRRGEGRDQKFVCRLALAEHFVGRGGLKADVQCDERIVHRLAHTEQRFAAADDLGIFALGEVDLIFDKLHHRLSGREEVDGGELMLAEDRGNFFGQSQQRIVIGAGALQNVEPCNVVLLQQHNVAWLNILQSSCAYYYALLGLPEKIPAVFREHQLASIHFLAPGKPMMELIENQVYLAQGEYAKVIGRSEALLGMCEAMHYALVALHIRLQTAAAYEMLGKRETADELLISALAAAEPDALYLPFVENYRYLKTALTRGAGAKFAAFVRTVTPLGEDFVRRCGEKRAEGSRPAALAGLTERESAIAALVAKRLSNREIAEQLFLSEGSVKQYINQIYSMLLITGDVRTKRKRLAELAAPKS